VGPIGFIAGALVVAVLVELAELLAGTREATAD
jgi:hypothetical protein